MKAPNGIAITGTDESIPGTAVVNFTEEGYVHVGTTEMHWDGSETRTIAKATVFVDKNGEGWMEHHLIPEDAKPLSAELIVQFRREECIGKALDAAEACKVALDLVRDDGLMVDLPSEDYAQLMTLRAGYAILKAASIRMLQKELKAQGYAA